MGRLFGYLKEKSRFWKIPLIVCSLLLVVGGVYAYSVYSDARSIVDEDMNQEVASIDHEVTKKKIERKEPLNILLMGVDERDDDQGRSDALMVLSVDPNQARSQLISIPRDTRTELVGDAPEAGRQDKINHAYAFGGTDMAINTVESLLDFELDYYVKMNMEGLSGMVDAVGGITVNNELDWYDTGHYEKGFHYAEGELEMNGPQTMGFVRMRYQDPDGDFGRNERQRKVIQAVINKGASIKSVHKIGDMMDVLGTNVTTNMNFSTMQDLIINYRSARENMTTYQMSGTGTEIDGIYYLQVSDQEIREVSKMIEDYSF
ncbi:LCP family protein [Halobacillus locisalis]|uniref:LCP family protein n=1 Tax=Halobacillus locisalis TaxID=220753 RepID=A0A838CUV2_9BACI|nr:LCP family protein [Halobacillus locisalis]MBA2175386.1 LCP family protein [Halobacillus locisalis]